MAGTSRTHLALHPSRSPARRASIEVGRVARSIVLKAQDIAKQTAPASTTF